MNIPINERISALVDGESGEFETRRLTAELLSNESHKARWSHYHLIGDAMRDELPTRVEPNFSASVMALINEDMPGYDNSLVRKQSRWLKPAAGFAIAASVAAVSVLAMQSLTSPNSVKHQIEVATSPAAISQSAPKATPVAVVNSTTIEETRPAANNEFKTLEAKIVDSRMNSYLATHAEYTTQPLLMPQVRVVGFEQNN